MISKKSLEILKQLAETEDCSIHWFSEYNIALDEAINELDIKEKSAECEYCKQDMEGKSIENRYAIETMVDDIFLYNWCECGRHTVAEINYCPMCGRKLV